METQLQSPILLATLLLLHIEAQHQLILRFKLLLVELVLQQTQEQKDEIQNLDERAEGYPIVRERKDKAGLKTVMSNSVGFGGTNATLVMQKV